MNKANEALSAEKKFRTSVEEAQEYIENFDILETINNVGNDEVFTPVSICQQILDVLPQEVWSNPNYKWLNPCDKNGVFLREIALRLDSGLVQWESNEEKRRKHILQNMIYSIGLTKFTSQVSRRTVYYCSQANRKFDGQVDQDGHSINGYAIGNGEWFDTDQGNVLTPVTEHTFKKGKCIYCGTAEKDKNGQPGRYSDPKQLEHYAYEFIHIEDIQTHLQKRFFGGKKVKFDIIIGNPPYQLTDGGGGSSSKPIYNLFVNQAISLKPKYMSMIIPSRWFSGGKGLDDFRAKMISDKHIRVLHDYLLAQTCFPSVSIEGGVCYFLWDRDNEGKCKIVSHDQEGNTKVSERYLSDNTDILIRDEKSLHILMKVQEKMQASFSSIVSPRNPYGISKIDESEFVDKKNSNTEISIFGRFENSREVRYLKPGFTIKKGKKLVNVWKVFISKADGAAGQIGNPIPARIIGKAEVGAPNVICSETFLVVGPFETENQAINVSKYMSTKFFRFMVGIRKNKNMTQDTYKYAPLLTSNQIWTDIELYNKFDLDQEDIEYIEKYIKELD
ncbi:MAG: Eco57I restriction-modification methylase domain-containing protein [Candidatus Delongbacteria bacterium]|nr:Eco57I restriction-modification methylase domain-containing protein [Candidatus Delongbacteria bacterium]